MKNRKTIVATLILLAAPIALFMAIGCAQPSMTYQGVLTDASGNPVADGAYDAEFRLWDTVDEKFIFTQTNPITVTNGLFNVVLGDPDPLPIEQFGHGLELEIAVEGDTLSPRQTLYGAPYAFTLYPGAVIFDGSSISPSLTIVKNETLGTPALRLEGGAFQSDRESYIWVPGCLGVEAGNRTGLTVGCYLGGAGWWRRPAGEGDESFMIPIQLPGVLYGQNVTIDQITVYYRCGGDCGTAAGDSRITSTRLHRMTAGSSQETVAENDTDYASTTDSVYNVSGFTYEIGTGTTGVFALEFDTHHHDDNDTFYVAGLRVRLKHE